MRKLIDIPEENKVLENLQILAVKAKKDLKNYIQDLLVEHVRGQKINIAPNGYCMSSSRLEAQKYRIRN